MPSVALHVVEFTFLGGIRIPPGQRAGPQTAEPCRRDEVLLEALKRFRCEPSKVRFDGFFCPETLMMPREPRIFPASEGIFPAETRLANTARFGAQNGVGTNWSAVLGGCSQTK